MKLALPVNRPITTDWYELGWPLELDAQAVASWLQVLNSSPSSPGLQLIMSANSRHIQHYMAVAKRHNAAFKSLVGTLLPSIELTKIDGLSSLESEPLTVKLSLSNHGRVLQTKDPSIISQALLASVSTLGLHETVTVRWQLGPRLFPQTVSNHLRIFPDNSWTTTLIRAFNHAPQPLDSQTRKSMRAKLETPGWKARLVVEVWAQTLRRRQSIAHQVVSALHSSDNTAVHWKSKPSKQLLGNQHAPWFWPLQINIQELVGLLGWPFGDQTFPGISRLSSRNLKVPSRLPANGRVIAAATVKNSSKKVTLSSEDALMHTHIIGPTGVGKSTLLLNLIAQDIQAGSGVIVIDPKGDLIQATLQRLPKKRWSDVVVLDPSDASRPVGLNPLTNHGQPPTLIVDDILAIFHSLYRQYFGPRTQDILHAGLLTLSAVPNASLCALPLIYTNPVFRHNLVESLDDPLGLGSFWSWFDTLSAAERSRVLSPVMNKLRAFLLRPAIRRVMGQSNPTFKLQEVFSKRKILLVNLARGNLGSETSQLFGSLLLSQVWQAIQARISVEPKDRKPCFVYIDEVQDYLHLPTDIGDILAQSRSYGVGMTLAHQHLKQLPPILRSGVLANARNKICFQLSHDDAVVMAKQSRLLTPADFENAARYHIYARLIARGEVQPWTSGKTLGLSKVIGSAETVYQLSRKRYGRDAAIVESEIGGLIAGTAQQANQRMLFAQQGLSLFV